MKKINRFIRGGFVNYYDSEKLVEIPEKFVEKSQETRGVWFSTVANIDFEVMKDVESFQTYLKNVIRTVKAYHMNTIVFQVRPTNDAFYESQENPWSRFITGEEDQNPGFDVLEWVIQEATKQGIDVHAWFNPYRVTHVKMSELGKDKATMLASLSPKNWARRHPECVLETSESKLILDPASVEVQQFVAHSATEIAAKYGVKAIHIDDYFYPYEAIIDPHEEEKHQARYPELSLADFRRQNVTDLMGLIAKQLKALPKTVEFGISPFGIYRTDLKQFEKNGKKGGWIGGSQNHYSCFQGYEGLYADVLLWMKNGWLDYVVPQVYFDFDNYVISKEDGSEVERVKYADLVDWWVSICQETNTKLYIGQGFYRYSDKGNWSNPEEIPNQLKYNSKFPSIAGTVFFTYRDFVKTTIPAQVEAQKTLKTMWTKDVRPQ
ncbi:MAG: family 10 glycosylhydrolase [Bacilli bacterium]